MAISRRARFIRWLTGRYIRSIDVANAPIDKMRRRLDALGKFARSARGVSVEKTTLAGMHAEWYRPEGVSKGKILLYIHGGAYVLGSCESHRKLVTHMARAAGVEAVMPEYRLAPEHPFPAGVEDTVAAYRALLDQGYEPGDVFISGDSAGGGLSTAALLQLRHDGVPLPRAAILLSPHLDMTASGESMQTRADVDPWFSPGNLGIVVRYYCPDEDLRAPLVSPVFANVAGLPPFLIHVGDHEILLNDSTRLADNLRAAGVDVEIEVFPELWHAFHLFVGKMPESGKAIAKIADYMRAASGG